MKYENKEKADELCNRIGYQEKLLSDMDSACIVGIKTRAGHSILDLKLDKIDEEPRMEFLSSQVGHFVEIVSDKIETEINRLKRELEKL